MTKQISPLRQHMTDGIAFGTMSRNESDTDCALKEDPCSCPRCRRRVMSAVFAMSATSPVYLRLRKDCGTANRRSGPKHNNRRSAGLSRSGGRSETSAARVLIFGLGLRACGWSTCLWATCLAHSSLQNTS
jgi:hypothetical protein